MTPEQIKELAKQAGAKPYHWHDMEVFSPEALIELVRIVRQQAFEEAAEKCRELADCEENTQDYRHGAAWCESRIRSLK